MTIAVRVENISKQYRIGSKQDSYRTMRDVIAEIAVAPFKRLHGLIRGEASAASNLNETFWALQDVSFDIQQGDVVGIIGKNGAGKSTLLKILSRITEPTDGRLWIRGRVGALLEVGTGFHPELTGRENVYLNGAILGMSRLEIERKFDDIVAFAEIEKFIDTPVKHYSSGMGLRLGFAVAAHLEPEILIVDEVLAVGDAAFQKKCLGKMSEVAGQGRTVLFVSHNMQAVSTLCTHGIILSRGSVSFMGSAADAVANYLSEDGTPASTDATLTNAHRRGNGDATFERIAVRSGDCELRFPYTGEDVQVSFWLRCHRPIRNATVGLEVWDSNGARIIDANTRMLNTAVNMEPGEYRCWTFNLLDVRLRPARYRLAVWAGKDFGSDIDYVSDALLIDVMVDPSNPMGTVDYPGIYRCNFDISSEALGVKVRG